MTAEMRPNSEQILPLPDVWFEKREQALGQSRSALGTTIAGNSGRLTAWLPSHRRARVEAELELVYTLSGLMEVRELRRTLLGMSHNAHIRGRALPNFVADNPSYAKVVADELPLAVGTQEQSSVILADPAQAEIAHDASIREESSNQH